MAIDKYVRAHTRNELREVAKLAKPAATPGAFRMPYTSGYVDFSEFAPKASPPAQVPEALPAAQEPAPAERAIDQLTPASMAPVSLSALVSTDEPTTIVSARRRRRTLTLALATGCLCAALAVGAFVKHAVTARGAERAQAALVAAAPQQAEVAPGPAAPAQPTPSATAAALASAPLPDAAKTAAEPVEASAAALRKKPGRGRATPLSHPAPQARTAPLLPRTKPTSGDPLMDAMRQSVSAAHR